MFVQWLNTEQEFRMFQWNMELTWTDGTSFYFVISIVLKHFECEIAFSSMISQRNTAFMLKLVRKQVKPGHLGSFELIRGDTGRILTSNGYSPTISSRSGSQLMLIIFGRQFESLKDFRYHVLLYFTWTTQNESKMAYLGWIPWFLNSVNETAELLKFSWISNDSKAEPISWEMTIENPIYNFYVGVWVGRRTCKCRVIQNWQFQTREIRLIQIPFPSSLSIRH